MRKLLFLSLAALSANAFAQSNSKTTAVVVQEAAQETPKATAANAEQSAGEVNARLFFKALQENDAKALQNFVATKETYRLIADEYAYKAEQKRLKAKEDIETGYEKQAANIVKSFQTVQADIKAAGVDINACSVSLVQVRERENGGLRGGRALVQLKDAANHEIVIILRGFYEFKGKWYVMSEAKLREAKQ